MRRNLLDFLDALRHLLEYDPNLEFGEEHAEADVWAALSKR